MADDREGARLPDMYVVLGIAVAIAGNILINVALNVQRYAHIQVQRRQQLGGRDAQITYLNSGLWWLGSLLMTVGETGNFMAYGFAPASVVSPLGVFALLSNCVVAPLFFHEKMRRRNFVGVGVAVVGILLIVWSAQPGDTNSLMASTVLNVLDDGTMDPYHYIVAALTQPSFKIYGLVSGSLIVCLHALSRYTNLHEGTAPWLFCNIGLVALFGAYTALSTKCISSLLSFSIDRAFSYGITYVLVVVLVLSAVLQVIFLNRALQHFPASVVVPVHFVFFTISVIIASAVIFRDFEHEDSKHLTMFMVGCVLTFIGVWLITSKEEPRRSRQSFGGTTLPDMDEESQLLDDGASSVMSIESIGDNADIDPAGQVSENSSLRMSMPGSGYLLLTAFNGNSLTRTSQSELRRKP